MMAAASKHINGPSKKKRVAAGSLGISRGLADSTATASRLARRGGRARAESCAVARRKIGFLAAVCAALLPSSSRTCMMMIIIMNHHASMILDVMAMMMIMMMAS
jgi:hypothetical protein